MAKYTVINELHAIHFHDACLKNAYFRDNALYMTFASAIIIGHSCPDKQRQVPCSVNVGEDRYACPTLTVTLKGFLLCSVLRGGYRSMDCEGNILEERPSHRFSPEELDSFLQMLLADDGGMVSHLAQDDEPNTYTLCFFLSDANYYEMTFSATETIAEFEEFGGTAWYLDNSK